MAVKQKSGRDGGPTRENRNTCKNQREGDWNPVQVVLA